MPSNTAPKRSTLQTLGGLGPVRVALDTCEQQASGACLGEGTRYVLFADDRQDAHVCPECASVLEDDPAAVVVEALVL